MTTRLDTWNARYAARRAGDDDPPEALLFEAMACVTPGRALDVACGAGRHALALAGAGFQVDAVDGSTEGLALLRRAAEREGLSQRIDCIEADLESDPIGFEIPTQRYDLVADFFFLQRTLLGAMRDAVRPGGVFVAAIHCAAGDAPTSMNRAFTLQPGELEGIVRAWGFDVVVAREGVCEARTPGGCSVIRHEGRTTAEVIARRPG